MTDDWKIVGPDGKEYERMEVGEPAMYDEEWAMLYVRPKRKQTGFICRECGVDVCVFLWEPPACNTPSYCPGDGRSIVVQPFYGSVDDPDGKVVE
jgi:hypothetical protein